MIYRETHIDGHRMVALAYNEDRPGPAVVFLHGYGSNVAFWQDVQTPIVQRDCRWYAVSLPGHYPANLPPDYADHELTAESIASVVAGAITELVGPEPVMLVGHSTGGFAALAVAVYHPERVHSVISVGGFAHGRWTGTLGIQQTLARYGGPLGRLLVTAITQSTTISIPAMRSLLRRAYIADHQGYLRNPALTSFLMDMMPYAKRLDTDALYTYMRRMPRIDISHLLLRVRVPVVAIAGTQDPVVPASQSWYIASEIPGGSVHMLEGVGHLPMLEQPGAYHALLTEQIRTIRAAIVAA